MDKIATENLFLLEFLVDNVNLDPNCECSAPAGETCVSFQFLDNAPLDVCEADFNPARNYSGEKDSIKSGKSCLYSLSPDQANTCMDQFDILVTIFKKMQPGWLPDKVEVGDTLISICNLFAELITSVETSDGTSPTAKTLKDSFDINDPNGDVIGKIGVYIRMSCFGKLIVTQFQMNLDDKSVLFKDKEGKSLYRYKKAGKGGNTNGNGHRSDACTTRLVGGLRESMQGGYNMQCPTNPCGGGGQSRYGSNGNGNNGNGNNNNNCPFSPCIMDNSGGGGSFAQPGGGGSFAQPGGRSSFGQPGGGGSFAQPRGGGSFSQPGGRSSFAQPGGGGSFAQPGVPCQECGQIPNAPCGQPSQGMGNGGFSPNMMSPCIECGNIPNAPCLPPQTGGFGMSSAMTPCIECGNIPNAPCVPPQSAAECHAEAMMQRSAPLSNTPCMDCANMADAPCAPPPPAPEGNYQEIGASMGGNSLTIRVHKGQNKIEQVDPNASVASEEENDGGCCCSPGHPGKKKKGQAQGQGGGQTLSMRPGIQQGNQNIPFSFRMGKGGENGDNNVVVNPPVATRPDGTQFTEFSDPNKELFVLRVGKKSEGVGKKQNLELELCTPRGKAM